MRFILFLKIRILQNLMFISTNHSVEVVHDVVHPLAVSCHYFIAHSCLVLLLTEVSQVNKYQLACL